MVDLKKIVLDLKENTLAVQGRGRIILPIINFVTIAYASSEYPKIDITYINQKNFNKSTLKIEELLEGTGIECEADECEIIQEQHTGNFHKRIETDSFSHSLRYPSTNYSAIIQS